MPGTMGWARPGEGILVGAYDDNKDLDVKRIIEYCF